MQKRVTMCSLDKFVYFYLIPLLHYMHPFWLWILQLFPTLPFFPSNCFCKTKMGSRSHHKEVVCRDIYSPPSTSSIGKKLMIKLVGLLLWTCFVANGVKCLSMIHHSSCTQRCWEKLVWFWFQQNCLWPFHLSSFQLICICPTLLLEKHLRCCCWEFCFWVFILDLGILSPMWLTSRIVKNEAWDNL